MNATAPEAAHGLVNGAEQPLGPSPFSIGGLRLVGYGARRRYMTIAAGHWSARLVATSEIAIKRKVRRILDGLHRAIGD